VQLNPNTVTDGMTFNFNGLPLFDGNISSTLGRTMHTINVYEEGAEPMSAAVGSVRDFYASDSIWPP
jgi:hypothetical protein